MLDFIAPMSATSGSSRNIHRIITSILIFCLAACTALSKGHESGAVLLDSVRVKPADIREIPVTVDYAALRQAQSNYDLNSPLRIVKLVLSASPGSGEVLPQYRLFEVRKGSIADVLGLQTADVLVGANGYVVYNPEQFKRYMMSIPVPTGTYIEIRREGRPLFLRYDFRGMPNSPKANDTGNAVNVENAGALTSSASSRPETILPRLSPTPDNPVNLTKPVTTPSVNNSEQVMPTVTATPTPKAQDKDSKDKKKSKKKAK